MTSDGVAAGKEFAREGFVDHHGGGSEVVRVGAVFHFAAIGVGKVATGHDRHAERGEIIRADRIHVWLGAIVGFVGTVAFHGHAAVPLVVFENTHAGEADAFDPGKRFEAFGEFAIGKLPALGRVTVQARIDFETNQAGSVEAGSKLAEIVEAAEKETGADEEQKRKRHLHDDERFPQALIAATDDGARFVFEHSPYVGLRGLQRRARAQTRAR